MSKNKIFKSVILASLIFGSLCFLEIESVHASSCILSTASKPIDIINWQGKIDLVKGFFSFSAYEDKVLILKGNVLSQYSNIYVPLSRVGNDNSYVADLNFAIIIGALNRQLNGLSEVISFSSIGMFFTSPYDSSGTYTQDKILYVLKKDGSVEEIGTMLGSYLQDKENSTILYYKTVNKEVFIYKLNINLGISLPVPGEKIKNNLDKIKNFNVFISDNRIFFAPNYLYSNTNYSNPVSIIDINTDSIYTTSAIVSPDYKLAKLSNGEEVTLNKNYFNSTYVRSNYYWSSSSSGKISFKANNTSNEIPVDIPAGYNSSEPFTYESYFKEYLLIKSKADQQMFIVNGDKVICENNLPKFKESENVFLKTKFENQVACDGSDSSLQGWDGLTQKNYEQVINQKEFSFEDIDYLLQRYLRSDSLTEKDIELIETIYFDKIGSEFNDLLVILLDKFSSKVYFRNLSLIFRNSAKVKKITGKLNNVCMNKEARTQLSSVYKNLLLDRANKMARANPAAFNIQSLLFIKNYLRILTSQDKEDLASDIGTLLAHSIQQNDRNLALVFFSTLDWLSTQKVRDFFGIKPLALTDLIVTSNDSYVSIIGTNELLNDTDFLSSDLKRTQGGFYYYNPIYLSLYDSGTKKFSWYHGDDLFEGDVIKQKRKVDFVPKPIEGPNREELLDDKIYHGVVVLGSNLHGSAMDNTKNNYLYYLKQQNFVVAEPIVISDSIEYLKERIIGKKEKLDFFVKEAHSDGDYRNLFSINKKMFLVRATLPHQDYQEIIDIMYTDGSYSAEYISNQQFGEWLKIRENEKLGGQFIYLNTSCSSYTKAAAELGTAASNNLVIIASESSVYTFSVTQDNATYHLFDGIRKMSSFADISKTIKGMRGSYLFPMEESYKFKIFNNINAGYETYSKVYKISESGERIPYQIEQLLNAARSNP